MKRIFLIALLLLCISVPAHALPMLYDVSGQFRSGSLSTGYEYEDFKGSFILADPTITYDGPCPSTGCTRGDYLVRYSIIDFTISSISYSLTQNGTAGIGIWYASYQDWRLNGLDSGIGIGTSLGRLFAQFFEGWTNVEWNGGFAEQPISFTVHRFETPLVGGLYVVNATAVQIASVPEPTTVLLIGLGLIGLAGFRNKIRS